MTWTARHQAIHLTLNKLNELCGFMGESGTEEFFGVLYDAVQKVADQWDDVVGKSHDDGLCYDVNAMLAEALLEVLSKSGGGKMFAQLHTLGE